jgi:hypothetical protein
MTKQDEEIYQKKLAAAFAHLKKQQLFGQLYGMNTDNQNKVDVNYQKLKEQAYEAALKQYAARDTELTATMQGWAEQLKNRVANSILEHIICEFPFPYIDMTQVTANEAVEMQQDSKVGLTLCKLIRDRKDEYKVAVDTDTMEFFVSMFPEFFDGLTLITKAEVYGQKAKA